MGYLEQPRKYALFGKGRRASDRGKSNGANEQSRPMDVSVNETANDPMAITRAARKDLLDQISDFLTTNELDVTPEMLMIAHSALSGSDHALAGKIMDRQIRDLPISQQWLETLAQPKAMQAEESEAKDQAAYESQRNQIDAMVDTLEQSIHTFSQSTLATQGETGQCHSQFKHQIGTVQRNMGEVDQKAFLQIAQTMLGTLQRIETTMRDSHAETEILRNKLRKARHEAEMDHLTGLPNRRAFERRFNTYYTEALAQKSNLFVAICDIDHFKRINDTFGHKMGDRLLCTIATTLNDHTSQNCFVARHGGEEFALLIHADNITDAHRRLDMAREHLARRKFFDRDTKEPLGQVTFSAGLADVMASDDPRKALGLADRALYLAKREGRNQVRISQA